jgi:hypothetical protein
MARPNPIRKLMEQPLPGITYQRRLQFRPTYKDIDYVYDICNHYLFDNRLKRPYIEQGIRRQTWGFCRWDDVKQDSGSYCKIYLSDKWFCPQWFVQTLSHEMVHQYQWDIMRFEGYTIHAESGCHGPSFFEFRDLFDYYGLNLKTSHGRRRWFRHQDFSKC